MPEELRFQQGLGKGGAVDRNERFRCVGRAEVDLPGHQLFAGSAFPTNDDVRSRPRHLTHQLEDLHHGRVPAHEPGVFIAFGLLSAADGGPGLPILEDSGQEALEVVKIQGFDEEIHGPLPHGGCHRGKILIGRHHDDVEVRGPLPQESEQLQAVHPGHLEVDQGNRRRGLRQPLEGFLRVRCRAHFLRVPSQGPRKGAEDPCVVVDDQDGPFHGLTVSLESELRERK